MSQFSSAPQAASKREFPYHAVVGVTVMVLFFSLMVHFARRNSTNSEATYCNFGVAAKRIFEPTYQYNCH